MRCIDLEGHTRKGLWILVDINIIMRVFKKKLQTRYLYIRGERPQLKMPTQALCKFSPFVSFSLGEEL